LILLLLVCINAALIKAESIESDTTDSHGEAKILDFTSNYPAEDTLSMQGGGVFCDT